MTVSDWIAVATFGLALLGVMWKLVEPVRQDLQVCKRERTELRRRLELVIGTIIRTLPREERIDLLAQLDERIPPITEPVE